MSLCVLVSRPHSVMCCSVNVVFSGHTHLFLYNQVIEKNTAIFLSILSHKSEYLGYIGYIKYIIYN